MPKVVIIGAGTAGLACARELCKDPSYEVVIIEALDRVGGRLYTVNLGEHRVDLGASWCHESRHNPLFVEALKQGWPLSFTDEVVELATQHGGVPRSKGINAIIQELHGQIEEFAMSKQKEPTLKEFATKAINDMPLITDEQKMLALRLCRSCDHFTGMNWEEIPTADGLCEQTTPLGRDVYISDYTLVLEWLKSSTDVDIKLNEEVLEIREHSVLTSKEELEADFIVCTIPLGVLKRFSFKVQLPTPLIESIKNSTMAAMGKVILEFPSVFWDPTVDSLFVAHTEVDEATVGIVNPYKGTKPVLVCTTSPPLTQAVESDPKHAYDRIKWALQAASVTGNVPNPTNVVVSDWTQNPYFRGSYSGRSMGQTYDEAVGPFIEGAGQLRFAGEHTTMEGTGCVHGAFLSGEREAEYIMNFK